MISFVCRFHRAKIYALKSVPSNCWKDQYLFRFSRFSRTQCDLIKIHNIPRDISLEEFFPPLYVFIRMDVSYKDRIGYFLKDEFASQILLPNFYLASISIKLTSFILFQTSISRQKQFFSPNIFNSLKTLHQELQFIPHKKKKNFHWIWHL